MAATPDRDAVLNALRVVHDPDLRRDIVSLGFIKDLTIDKGACPSPSSSRRPRVR
jgi:metal-sulfur cluster biosynthetic enzyme